MTAARGSRPSYDAALHLLDRQVVDSDGRLVAKVDDVELVRADDGRLLVTGILSGLPALLPRFGPRAGSLAARVHREIRWAAADQEQPLVIGFDLVDEVTSEVRLSCSAEGLLERAQGGRWRLGTLLGTPVHGPGVHRSARVLDARVRGRLGGPGDHVVEALVVGPGRPGALLGYDRRSEPGPWLVGSFVRWLHRHAVVVDLGAGVELDLEAGEVRITGDASVRPLLG
ncbi:MAG TPA: hypothetical protein VNT31_13975 [Nocardioides sp.]|nr:hypothetical protein [Nocardioides sp.]